MSKYEKFTICYTGQLYLYDHEISGYTEAFFERIGAQFSEQHVLIGNVCKNKSAIKHIDKEDKQIP